MEAIYHLALLGHPRTEQVLALRDAIEKRLAPFGLLVGEHVAWHEGPGDLHLEGTATSAAAYFGQTGAAEDARVRQLVRGAIPVIPVVSTSASFRAETPDCLHALNGFEFGRNGSVVLANALLESMGLLPRQRRLFISYRRSEARQAAAQLFENLSGHAFDVFLDTYDVRPGEDVQAAIWHRLCDSDVFVMLDTETYFESRWTEAEFGRALAKGISVLRVGWPDTTPSARTATTARVELLADECDPITGKLADGAVERIWLRVEELRSQSHAVRRLNLMSNLRREVEQIGGSVGGLGTKGEVRLGLPGGLEVTAYVKIGVPTSRELHDASAHSDGRGAAVIFDPIGLRPEWLEHLEWLGANIKCVRWLKSTELAWGLAAWRL